MLQRRWLSSSWKNSIQGKLTCQECVHLSTFFPKQMLEIRSSNQECVAFRQKHSSNKSIKLNSTKSTSSCSNKSHLVPVDVDKFAMVSFRREHVVLVSPEAHFQTSVFKTEHLHSRIFMWPLQQKSIHPSVLSCRMKLANRYARCFEGINGAVFSLHTL